MLWGRLASVAAWAIQAEVAELLSCKRRQTVASQTVAWPRIKKLIDTSSFVAVNLYAKSIFGEALSWWKRNDDQ